MNLPPPGGAPKKDSIFSSIAPAPAPAPAAAPAPRAVPDAEVSALKGKIDALEKNIVSQLEKKLAEQLKAIPAAAPAAAPAPQVIMAPPAAVPDALIRKIEDLERRLSDFGQSAALSASQLKNIEESKISARREIEDLLKAVREQQKYSELDRQMHEQLQKAWTRAEELEKKLMDFYSTVLAMEGKRREESAASDNKAADALQALSARLAGLEQKLSALSPVGDLSVLLDAHLERAAKERAEEAARAARERAEFQAAVQARAEEERAALRETLRAAAEQAAEDRKEIARQQEAFFARAAQERRALESSQEASFSEALASLRETSASFKEIFDNYVRRELELLRDKVTAETESLRRDQAAAAEDFRKLARELAAASGERAGELARLLQENRLRADGVETALQAAAARQAAALEEFTRSLGSQVRAANEDFAAALKRESEERFARFGARYADALLSVTFVENFRVALASGADALETMEARLRAVLRDVPLAQLEKVTGVSGEVLRSRFEEMLTLLENVKAEVPRLRAIKRDVEGRFKDIFGEGR